MRIFAAESKIFYMAKYLPGAFTPIISGGVGATVFSHNSSGTYIKNKTIPINPSTIYQVSARSLFTTYSQLWRTLSPANQALWNAFAIANPIVDRVGSLITISGINMYIRCNSNIINGGGSAILAPPFGIAVPAVLTLTGTCIAAAQILTFTPTPVPVGSAMFCWATAPQSLGKSFVRSQFRLYHISAAAVASPLTVTTFYNARFGAPPAVAGAKIFHRLQFVQLSTGWTSALLQATVLTS